MAESSDRNRTEISLEKLDSRGGSRWLVYLYFAVRSGSLAVRSRGQINEANSFLRRRMHASKKHPQIFILAVHYRDGTDDSLSGKLISLSPHLSLQLRCPIIFIVSLSMTSLLYIYIYVCVPRFQSRLKSFTLQKNVFSFFIIIISLSLLFFKKKNISIFDRRTEEKESKIV